jgi:hypothetical protein
MIDKAGMRDESPQPATEPLETQETLFGLKPHRAPLSPEQREAELRRLRERAAGNPALAAALEIAANGGPDVGAILALRAEG